MISCWHPARMAATELGRDFHGRCPSNRRDAQKPRRHPHVPRKRFHTPHRHSEPRRDPVKIDRSHSLWILFVILATAVCGFLFVANFFPHRLPFPFSLPAFLGSAPPLRRTFGGTPLGLIFGSAAFLIFLFAAALGIRKKKRTWPIGSVQWWLKAHIWLTVLTLPLVLFHCGFHLGGWHTGGLMVLYAIVMVSGVVGIVLQQFVPGLMRERLAREFVFEEIPHLRSVLVQAVAELREDLKNERPAVGTVSSADADQQSLTAILRFADQDCIPYLSARDGRAHRLGNERAAIAAFSSLRLNTDPKWKPRIDQLQKWCDERRMMDLQTRLHHLLHGWLIVHVPSSVALLVGTAWHALAAVSFVSPAN